MAIGEIQSNIDKAAINKIISMLGLIFMTIFFQSLTVLHSSWFPQKVFQIFFLLRICLEKRILFSLK